MRPSCSSGKPRLITGGALELLKSRPNGELKYAVLVHRGMLWLERREWSKAIADLLEAIQLNSAHRQAFEVVAQVYSAEGKPDQAVEQFTRAIRLRPDLPARTPPAPPWK